ncbi:unnamed protein product, partial [Symbiodinium sp. CCMP2592]
MSVSEPIAALPRQAKLHQEPECTTPEQRQQIDSLRHAALTLDGNWPFSRTGAQQPGRVSDTSSESGVSDSETIAWANILVYAPDYTPELLTIAFRFPATLDEGEQMIQAERDPARARIFPHIVPAFPQTLPGAGVYIACPHWQPDLHLLFVDSLGWDGRHFAVNMPAYVTRHTVLHIIGIEYDSPVAVYIGDQEDPVQTHAVHTRPGTTILLVPHGQTPTLSLDAATMMQRPSLWSQDYDVPQAPQTAYLVVEGDQQVLFTYRTTHPTRYRSDLAAALGIPNQHLALVPAQPRVVDACLQGRPFSEDGAGSWHPPESYMFQTLSFQVRSCLQNWTFPFGARSSPPHSKSRQITQLKGRPTQTQVTHTYSGHHHKLFAIDVPPRLYLHDLLALAGNLDSEQIVVYHNSQPWPLADMLQDPTSWNPDAADHVRRGSLTKALIAATVLPPGETYASPLGIKNVAQWDMSWVFLWKAAPHGLLAAPLSYKTGQFWYSSTSHVPMPMVSTSHHLLVDRPAGANTATSAAGYDAGTGLQDPLLQRLQPPSPPEDPSAIATFVTAMQTVLPHGIVSKPTSSSAVPHYEDITDWLRDGPTLLEQALQCHDNIAMQSAATFLTILSEHSTPPAFVSQQPSPAIASLCLETALPLTDHQRQSLTLTHLLPHSQLGHAPDPATDWLDADFRALLNDSHVELECRTLFVNFRTWYDEDRPPIDSVHIYSDGSATQNSADFRPAAWAFSAWANCGRRTLLLGHSSSQTAPEGTPFHIGEADETALTAELLGLAWALAWAAEFGRHYAPAIHFVYDALSAGLGAFGQASLPDGPYSQLASLVAYLRQYLEALTTVTHGHVHSHRGHPANEFVDQLAKHAARGPADHWDKCLPTWLPALAKHPYRAWAWATLPQHKDLPTLFAFESEASRLQSLPKHDIQPPALAQKHISMPPGEVIYHLCAITYNVLTLRDPSQQQLRSLPVGLRMIGRKGILKSSLAVHKPWLIGLQETRLNEAQSQHDSDYLIYQAPADAAGAGGCALWISRHFTYAAQGEQRFQIQAAHVTVLSHSPRHLTVSITAPRLRLLVVVLHAPSASNHPVPQIQTFWDTRADEIRRRPEGADYILLADSNARLGSVVSDHMSDLDAEEETAAGTLFHDFLVQIEGYLPATFSDCHSGESGTWRMPDSAWFRIDYVVLPLSWKGLQTASSVIVDFESMQKRDDHRPVKVCSTFARALAGSAYWTNRPRAIRPEASLRCQAHTITALQQVQPTDWEVPVDEHYSQLVTAWHRVVNCLQEPDRDQPHQPYLSLESLQLVRARQAFRRYLAQEQSEINRRLKIIVFAAFVHLGRATTFTATGLAAANNWLWVMDYSVATAVSALHWLGTRLRTAVAADRRAYLDSLVAAAAARDFKTPRELYQAIRKAFPAAASSRRSRFQPLPMLATQEGEPLPTSEARAEAWRAHFSAQESGVTVTPEEYVQHLVCQKSQATQVPFSLGALPTLCKTEQVVLNMRLNKAAGPDSLTCETLRLHTPTTTRQLFPVIAKTVLRIQEPTLWRGGELFVLAKRAGASMTCDSFRSIMVTSIASKVMHKCLRDELKPALLASQHQLQGGVRPGLGIETPILAVKTYALLSEAAKQPWAIGFVDLQAAFYSVIRQTLVSNPDSDAGYLELLHALQVPDYALHELKQHLQSLAELPRLGVNPHTIALVRDLFEGSWFRMTNNPTLTQTRRGSRPGDPAADILFSFTLSALFRRLAESLQQHNLGVSVPIPDSRPEWSGHADTTTIGNPAWADDFVVPQSGADPSTLLTRTQLSFGLLYAHTNCLGMKIKFGPEKTALLLSESARAQLLPLLDLQADGTACMPFQDPRDLTWHKVPVIQAYRHLGGVLTSPITPVPDLHFRYSRAEGTARPLRRCFFTSQRFSLAVRRNLLRSLVISKYVHSSSALVLRCATHIKLWERQYIALWRNLCRRIDKETLLHPFEVLHQAEALTPPLALAKARAGFLTKLLHEGSELLLTLLCDHWLLHPSSSWLGQLEMDVNYVGQYVPGLRAVLGAPSKDSGPSDAVPALITAIRENRKWWLYQVTKAERIQTEELAICAKCLRQARDNPTLPAALPSTSDCLPFACEVCSARFALRKHLCLHAAKAHGLLSPARHYALTDWCTACHRYYAGVRQVQQHLKHYPQCLRRCVDLYPPLEPCQIQQLERPSVSLAKKVKAGAWQNYQGRIPVKVPVIYGPFLPTAQERKFQCDEEDEDTLLSDLRAPYTPKASTVKWIEDYLDQKSTEG